MSAHSEFISPVKSNAIVQANEALIVLKHFIEFTYKVLPELEALIESKSQHPKDLARISKIKTEIESFKFSRKASEILMNSSIIELIRNAYKSIIEEEDRLTKVKKMTTFKKEYLRLKNNWSYIQSN